MLAAVGSSLTVMGASIVLSSGVALAVPGLIATVAGRATNANRGLALALYTFCLFIGASLAPPVSQVLAQFGTAPLWLLPAGQRCNGKLLLIVEKGKNNTEGISNEE